MASEVTICNRAMIKLGEATILTLDDNTKVARTCKQLYATTRDLVLRSHAWNFAKKRVELAVNSAAPEYDFDYSYRLPSDFIRLLIPDRNVWEYSIEGQDLVTNYASGYIKYIYRITDVAKFDPSFVEALACKIAEDAAIALSDNDARHKSMRESYIRAIVDAKNINAIEDGPKWFETEQWLDARRSGISGPLGLRMGQPR